MSEQPLLLHSVHEFWSLIEPCLDAVAPNNIVEVGGEGGTLTEDLLAWAQQHGASVTSVEPSPRPVQRRLVEERGLRLIERKSPDALEDVGACEVYVLDGDHNHWVVSAELEHALAQDETPLLIMHDVAWPAGRRDQYYNPADVPAAHRQPFSYDAGAVPDQLELVPGRGLRGEGAFAYALREGGQCNGVLSAVEEVLDRRPELELLRVPCIFGLGFLFDRAASYADEIRRIVGPFHESDLLARLERNRIDLFLRFIDPRGPAQRHIRAPADLIAGLQGEIERLQAEVSRLRVDLLDHPESRNAGAIHSPPGRSPQLSTAPAPERQV